MDKEFVWHPIKRPDLALLNSISDLIHKCETEEPGLLTSVRLGPTVILTCDFSGQHKDAEFECYSFLIADLAYLWFWDELRKGVRDEYLPNNRRMSFKGLNDNHRQRALVPFLQAAGWIPGLLLSILIDKSIHSLFNADKDLRSQDSKHWKRSPFEKLQVVAHIGALLLAGMSAPKQDVIWLSDEDEIAPNDQRLREVCDLVAHHCNHYLPHQLGHFRFGTARSDNGDRMIEDLIAIPDLAAGALCELAPLICEQHTVLNGPVAFHGATAQAKSACIMDWLTYRPHTLKKLLVRIFRDINGNVRLSCVYWWQPSDKSVDPHLKRKL